MKKTFNQFWMRVIPFIGMGIFLVLLAVGLVIFSYLVIFGAVVGLVLFSIFWVIQKLTRPKRQVSNSPRPGRTIDQDK